MSKRQKFHVYLAGSISGCNEAQKHQWRDDVKKKYGAYFDFTDPAKLESLGPKATRYEAVEADLKAIKQLDDIPSKDARHVFHIISETPGITRITLGPFNGKDSRRTCGASVKSSETPFLIEGKLYDKGKKGTMQTFHIRVQNNTEKARIENDLKASLKKWDRWFD